MKKEIINKFLRYFPKFNNEVQDIINDYNDIHLHLIFGDIFNPYLSELLNDPRNNQAELLKASELIEYMSNSDIYVQEVVSVTILERLSDEQEKFSTFRQIAGKQTQRFMDEI